MPHAGCKLAKLIACVALWAAVSQTYALEPVAATYLDEALTTIERNFYRSAEVDWEALRATALAQAQGARVPEDTYAAIVDLLIGLDAHSFLIGGPAARGTNTPRMGLGVQVDRLGDSFFIASVDPGSGADEVGLAIGDEILEVDGQPFHPARVFGLATSVSEVAVMVHRAGVAAPMVVEVPRRPSSPAILSPSAELLDGDIGYLVLPGHQGPGTLSDGSDYAAVVQEHLAELDSAGACAWVVDLRANRGGNFGPMLAGIGPLLGIDPLGGFDRSGSVETWTYQPAIGNAMAGTNRMHRSRRTFSVSDPDAPIAVLTGPATISAGEFVVLALRGRAETRSFGAPTGGLSTWVTGIRLSDGAVAVVSTGATADRTGVRFDGPIEPDVLVDRGADGTDAALDAALAWLRERDACAN